MEYGGKSLMDRRLGCECVLARVPRGHHFGPWLPQISESVPDSYANPS